MKRQPTEKEIDWYNRNNHSIATYIDTIEALQDHLIERGINVTLHLEFYGDGSGGLVASFGKSVEILDIKPIGSDQDIKADLMALKGVIDSGVLDSTLRGSGSIIYGHC